MRQGADLLTERTDAEKRLLKKKPETWRRAALFAARQIACGFLGCLLTAADVAPAASCACPQAELPDARCGRDIGEACRPGDPAGEEVGADEQSMR